jgi:hypothetical protein
MAQFENNDGIDNRDFARSQYEFLKNKNLGNRMQLSRIFKAAGPGQVQEAYKMSISEKWEADDSHKDRRSLLLMIIIGSSKLKLERSKIEIFLKENHFYVPTAKNDNCFYRVLRGAGEIMHPGSYHFSYRELQQIKEGLKKRVYDENDNVEVVDDVD